MTAVLAAAAAAFGDKTSGSKGEEGDKTGNYQDCFHIQFRQWQGFEFPHRDGGHGPPPRQNHSTVFLVWIVY
jgi:hypothetical protein